MSATLHDMLYGPLPMFPLKPSGASEDMIERMVERMVDLADALYMSGRATTDQYNRWNARLNEWAD